MQRLRHLVILISMFIPLVGSGVFAGDAPTNNVQIKLAGSKKPRIGHLEIYNPLLEIQNKIKHDKLVAHNKAVAKEKARVAAIQAARRLAKQKTAEKAVIAPQSEAQPVYHSSCIDPKSCIYGKESGNNPGATNPQGCYGLGQDCNGVVRNQCGANYVCQDAYFTNYAISRYGSWAAAWSAWQSKGWW